MPFTFTQLDIPEVSLIHPKQFHDQRGIVAETYKASAFQMNGIPKQFVQENYSRSQKGVLRGLHFQKHPSAQGKLVQVIRGEVFDVAVDIRQDSPTYGQWVSQILNARDHSLLWIPEGFAHGFLALKDHTELVYKVTHEYNPDDERAIRWNDPTIGIHWPIKYPILSTKDSQAPLLEAVDNNFTYQCTNLTTG